MAKGKPFVKWAGGKGQLIGQLEALLPGDFGKMEHLTYVEPFVGGGAMLFHMLQAHENIERAVINDINPDLTLCYQTVRDRPEELIDSLAGLQAAYHAIGEEAEKRAFYLSARERFNTKRLGAIENASLFIFLNRTCFNGLYRVNKSGLFNVPFGRYARPLLCDAETILADSRLLQRVEILTGDFEATLRYAGGSSFFYFDPPYRPLSKTSNFNDYAREAFDDASQVRLKRFCDRLHQSGALFMLSNSDCLGADGCDRFFDDLFADYEINRVWASRCVNANGAKRGKLTELLVRNYAPGSVGAAPVAI